MFLGAEKSPVLCPLDASRGHDYYDRNLALFEVSKEPFRCGRLEGASPDLSAKHQAGFSSTPNCPAVLSLLGSLVGEEEPEWQELKSISQSHDTQAYYLAEFWKSDDANC